MDVARTMVNRTGDSMTTEPHVHRWIIGPIKDGQAAHTCACGEMKMTSAVWEQTSLKYGKKVPKTTMVTDPRDKDGPFPLVKETHPGPEHLQDGAVRWHSVGTPKA